MKVLIILSRKQHNRIFPKRKWKWNTKFIITDDKSKHRMEMCQHVRNHWKLLIWFCFPIVILIGVPAYWNLIKEVFSGKSVGADTVNREWFYEQLSGDYKVRKIK